ncbi:MAG: hypothetical protein NTZ50_00120 [Chloroflexi bacterium]|nr:hypothetical protein [Chloroflexota bacterium]
MTLQRPILYIALGALLSLLLMTLIMLTVSLANAGASARVVADSDIALDAPKLAAIELTVLATSSPQPTMRQQIAIFEPHLATEESDDEASANSFGPDEDDGVRIIRERDDAYHAALRRIYATTHAGKPLRIVMTPATIAPTIESVAAREPLPTDAPTDAPTDTVVAAGSTTKPAEPEPTRRAATQPPIHHATQPPEPTREPPHAAEPTREPPHAAEPTRKPPARTAARRRTHARAAARRRTHARAAARRRTHARAAARRRAHAQTAPLESNHASSSCRG